MNPVLRNTLAIITGAVVGSVVNGFIIGISGKIIPPPAGADLTTMEGLKASMHLFTPINFLMPWLAHALGTFVGAIVAALIAVGNKMRAAMIVSVLFLIGGIINVYMLPAPMWFNAMDLLLAYLPMGYLGGKLMAGRK